MIRILSFIALVIFSISSAFSQIKKEEITINNMAIQLPGTLTYSAENQPLVIWVHGSGGVNRDGNTPNYIKQFRDEINKKEIAFFSYDKRTANIKNVKFIQEDGIYFSDFVSDLKEVINNCKNDFQHLNKKEETDVKNVLFIVLESSGAKYFDTYGGQYKITPNLNAYAEKALIYKNAYAHAPATMKSMVSLFGAIYPKISYKCLTMERPGFQHKTLPLLLKEYDYKTSFFTSANICKFLSEFFLESVCANANFLTFLLIFLTLYLDPLGPCATPPPTNNGAFLLACLAPPPPF